MVYGELPDQFQPTKNVAALRQCQLGGHQGLAVQQSFSPYPFWAGIDKRRDQYGRVDY